MNPNDHRPEGSAEPMKTFCHSFDEAYPAKIVDFHGWALPIQYDGILAEHAWTRSKCGMFNVSHMGRFRISGPHSADFLDELITGSVRKVANGQALYTLLCDPSGGILDDIIIYKHRSDDYFVVVNAAMRDADWAWMQEHIADRSVAMIDQSGALAQIALQGPLAEAVLQDYTDVELEGLRYFHHTHGTVLGAETLIAATGYTGEDGFELYLPTADALAVWSRLAADERVQPCGLGARDVLRMEAGLRLYGQDMDRTRTPLEAGLSWTVAKDKAQPFIGQAHVLPTDRPERFVGLTLEGRQAPRTGYPILDRNTGVVIGQVTSGGYAPSLSHSIAMGYVQKQALDAEWAVSIRGKALAAERTKLPFLNHVTRR
ncbi:MAG: glycine cleavage system aminomethyltransferase GcvT [Verrucomicrobiota bacterium]|nr:glycine cleavage system aminomethyltransferase GcvT [Verrucomicrobiota bacterium]